MDALSTILQSIRLRGSILSLTEVGAPWGVASPGKPRTAIFHALLAGSCVLRRQGLTMRLEPGDIVVLTRGDAHEMLDAPTTPTRPLCELERSSGRVPMLRGGGGGALTRVLCGGLHLDHAAAESFLSLLPEVLHLSIRTAGARGPWIRATLERMLAEVAEPLDGCDAMLTRMTDMLFVELLRGTAQGTSRGWLAALHDPQIGRALALIHEDPRGRWDADILAERVGMSRSRFFARFSHLVGEPPATYVARWRMSVAADILRREDVSTACLAAAAGYTSTEAFSRTFRKHFGVSPAVYRRSLRPDGVPAVAEPQRARAMPATSPAAPPAAGGVAASATPPVDSVPS